MNFDLLLIWGTRKGLKDLFLFLNPRGHHFLYFIFHQAFKLIFLNIELSSNIKFTGALFFPSSYTFWGWGAWVFYFVLPCVLVFIIDLHRSSH